MDKGFFLIIQRKNLLIRDYRQSNLMEVPQWTNLLNYMQIGGLSLQTYTHCSPNHSIVSNTKYWIACLWWWKLWNSRRNEYRRMTKWLVMNQRFMLRGHTSICKRCQIKWPYSFVICKLKKRQSSCIQLLKYCYILYKLLFNRFTPITH